MVTAHKMPPSQVQQAHLCEASRGGLAGSGDMSFSGHPAQPLPAAGEKATEPGEHDLCRCQVKKKKKGGILPLGFMKWQIFITAQQKT